MPERKFLPRLADIEHGVPTGMRKQHGRKGRHTATKMGTDPVNSTDFTGLVALLNKCVIIALANAATDKT